MTQQVPYGYDPALPPAPKRPPLSVEQKRGAMIAGGVGFTLMTFGFSLVMGVVIVTLVFALIGAIASAVERSAGVPAEILDGMSDFVRDYGWVAVVVAVVGVVLWLVGYFASVRILRSSGNTRATAITWAALGISIVASWVIGGILSFPFNLMTTTPGWDEGSAGAAIVGGVLSAVLGLAATAAIGVFAWWWMAHALRARE